MLPLVLLAEPVPFPLDVSVRTKRRENPATRPSQVDEEEANEASLGVSFLLQSRLNFH